MIIKRANKEDNTIIAKLMMLAMDDFIYSFIGEKSENRAIDFLEHFIGQTGNQYSYKNCYIAEIDKQIVGVANVYDGAKLDELRNPVIIYINQNYDSSFSPITETEGGEFYIDTIAIDPNLQGKGIGGKLLQFLKDEFVIERKQTLGLLVDKKNPGAKRLYLKHGFKPVKTKHLLGKEMEHLQLKP